MNTNKFKTVTIGIPAYKSADNIGLLLKTLLRQKETNFSIQKIMVYIDAPGDNTVEAVFKTAELSKSIQIFNNKERKGMAHGFRHMISQCKSEIFVLLNDDILIADSHFISKLIQPFVKDQEIGLVSGNPQPLPARNFISKAGISTFRAFERTRYTFREGNNKMTCDGKVLAISRGLIDELSFPKTYNQMGNVDVYIYFSCLRNNYKYKHVREAVAYHAFPNNLNDYIKWTTRGNSSKPIMKLRFGDIVDEEYRKPPISHLISLFIEAIKNPPGAIFIYIVGLYSKFKAKSYSKNFSPVWDVIASTKGKLG